MKRGSSGLSLLLGVKKPAGMSSHDVVHRCRNIFQEKRVGHAGTLDPLAEGVLVVCVGPATRLNQYLASERKSYIASIVLGSETTTDDEEGEVVAEAPLYPELFDANYASAHVESLVGRFAQVPPAYSAIKVNGKKSYEQARKGNDIALEPRDVEVFEAALLTIDERDDGTLVWNVLLEVSKGTYIRSIARDLGRMLGCYAHLGGLGRRRSGRVGIDDCYSLEAVEALGTQAALDPVAVLGLRFAFCDEFAAQVANGAKLHASHVVLYEPYPKSWNDEICSCTSSICVSDREPLDGELACMIVENRLKAIYRFDAATLTWVSDCVFSEGVFRG